ncbi:MAG: hypothetical protein A2W31_04125 [Planctomycetes bacterium RBG_16_64_10]|nr:MAG: hypothetical protein A2W31_04125 [Planctomycetes bacterium RBG_16_64_10]
MHRMPTDRHCPRATNRALRRAFLGGLIAASLVWLGCGPPPETDADDLIASVRNATVGAKVRYLGPQAQPYVSAVVQAYHAWQDTLAPMAELADVDALWPKDAALWHDPQAIAVRLDRIQTWLAATDRQQLRAELTRAVQAIPAPFRPQQARIRTELARLLSESPVEYLTRVAHQYESLLRLLQRARTERGQAQDGSTARDADTLDQAMRAWDQLYRTLLRARDEEWQRLTQTLGEDRRRRTAALERKKNASQSAGRPREAHRQRLKLDSDIHYYDQMIDRAEQRIRELRRAAAQPNPPRSASAWANPRGLA